MARKKKKKSNKRRSRPASPPGPRPPQALDPLDMLRGLAGLVGRDDKTILEALLKQVGPELLEAGAPEPGGAEEALLDHLRTRAGALGLPDPDFFEDSFDPLDDEAGADELEPEFPERCFPPIQIRIGGADASDPYATLGLAPGSSRDEVLAAFRSGLVHASPEDAPEIAAQFNDARALLLDHDRVFERLLGEIRVPDPDGWNLDRGRPAPEPIGPMAPEARMAAQLLLYALVEEQAIDDLRS